MEENNEIRIMRCMAWARAKGELHSMLWTYCKNPNFDKMTAAIKTFVEEVEDNGLQE